jgi:branched-chain amino acid transport system permease protein
MDYFIHLAILFGIYSILGISLNLVVGYTGLLSVAHAAFFGIGAYAVGILGAGQGVNFFISLGVGIIVAVIISFLIGKILSRLNGDYYVLGTVSFNYIIFSIFLNWHDLTRGPLGIPGIPRPKLELEIVNYEFLSNFSFLIFVSLFLTFVYFIARFIVNSSFGRVLKAIREDELAIQVFGYRTEKYKLTIFMIAAAFASVAGALFASYISFIDPTSSEVLESIFILTIVILGGLANLRGSILGALILVLLPELLRFVGLPPAVAAQMRQAIYGLILVLFMLFRPQGLIGEYKL